MGHSLQFILIGLLSAFPALGEELSTVRHQRIDGALFLHGGDAATAAGMELKVAQPEVLITFCTGGDNGICVPFRLASENHRVVSGELYLAAGEIESALQLQVVDSDNVVSVRKQHSVTRLPPEAEVPAYNSQWGSGRGFHVGDTLPDIPLMDTHGNEVRFSRYLGKRYILYCWASW